MLIRFKVIRKAFQLSGVHNCTFPKISFCINTSALTLFCRIWRVWQVLFIFPKTVTRCRVRCISYVKLYVYRCRIWRTIHVKLSLSNISITSTVTLKTTCRNGFIDNFSLRNDTEHTHLCKKTIYFFHRESAFPLDFLFCYFLSFLTRVRVLRRVFRMEPSTGGENIRQKRQRNLCAIKDKC